MSNVNPPDPWPKGSLNKPNFLIIGAQKAGSSWLARRLSQHPQIYVHPKEIHYFDKARNFARGPDWYLSHFDTAGAAKAIGEKTPEYFWPNGAGCEGHLPDVHRNIANLLPNAKLILVLRDPVTRAISAARHLIVSGRVSPFVSITNLLCGTASQTGRHHGLIEYGYYADHLRAFYEYFEQDNIHVLLFEEDIIESPTQALDRICVFLKVNRGYRFAGLNSMENEMRTTRIALLLRFYAPPLYRRIGHLAKRKLPPFPGNFRPTINPDCAERLARHFEDRNEDLFNLLGRHTHRWQSHVAPAG